MQCIIFTLSGVAIRFVGIFELKLHLRSTLVKFPRDIFLDEVRNNMLNSQYDLVGILILDLSGSTMKSRMEKYLSLYYDMNKMIMEAKCFIISTPIALFRTDYLILGFFCVMFILTARDLII